MTLPTSVPKREVPGAPSWFGNVIGTRATRRGIVAICQPGPVGLGDAGGILRRIFSNLEKLDVVFLVFLYLALIFEALHVV